MREHVYICAALVFRESVSVYAQKFNNCAMLHCPRKWAYYAQKSANYAQKVPIMLKVNLVVAVNHNEQWHCQVPKPSAVHHVTHILCLSE